MLKFNLENLTDEELGLLLYIINVQNKVTIPTMIFEAHHLKWFKHLPLAKKVMEVFSSIKPEGHSIYSSLLNKMGVTHEIRQEPPLASPITGSTEIPSTGSL